MQFELGRNGIAEDSSPIITDEDTDGDVEIFKRHTFILCSATAIFSNIFMYRKYASKTHQVTEYLISQCQM